MKNIFKMPAYVGIILVKDSTFLLVKRHNTDWAQGCWNFPGGLLEENETLVEAAIREIHEEVGVVVEGSSLELIHVLQVRESAKNTKSILGFYFIAKSWQGLPINNEPHRHSEIGWFSLDTLPVDSTEHALQALDGLQQNVHYSVN